MRKSSKHRTTLETDIKCDLLLDGSGKSSIQTGIGFLNHMLTLFAFYSQIDLEIEVKGDFHVDSHHVVEDIGLVLGSCIKEALDNKLGINRYGAAYIPMDESLARAVIDFSGRPYLVYNCSYTRHDLGTLDTQNIKEFFKSFTNTSLTTLHLSLLYGENDHHKAEALFKAFGQAIDQAKQIMNDRIPSTKGVLV